MNQGHKEFLSSPAWAEMLESDLLPWVVSVGDLGADVVEIGPGPGLTTDILRTRVGELTVVEADAELAELLAARLAGTNVTVVHADATDAHLPGDRFSAAASFSMLHHMPSAEHQDRLFAEISRMLRPSGLFVGVDALDLEPIRVGHVDDTFTPVPPETLASRLERVGLERVRLDAGDYQIRFAAWKPA
jgi:SAM-dependent methyltransferase